MGHARGINEPAHIHTHSHICARNRATTQYPDKKLHHVVNYYFDKHGTRVKNEGQVWNFHSWNDLWLHNVLGEKEGWCALDGTPPG